ncbi:MAG: VWA domain-containing protein [Planctomycetota bacterium]
MTLLYPEALLLLIPVGALWWRFLGDPDRPGGGPWRERLRRPGGWWRLAIAALGVVALSGPAAVLGTEGADLVIVVDRSSSMTDAARERTRELIRLAEDRRGPHDRVGVITFGGRAAIERRPENRGHLEAFGKEVDPDASSLRSGLELALEMIPSGRAARVLALTDGAATGADPRPLASAAAARGIPIDYRRLDERTGVRDVAVGDFALPAELQPGEAFQFSVELTASEAGPARWVLYREGERIAESSGDLVVGSNRLVFRDRVWTPGPARYELEVIAGDDRVPENDRGRGVTRVVGDAGILLFTHDGAEGNLGRALRAAGRPIRAVGAEIRPLDFADLAPYRAVVLENLAVGDFRESELEALRRFVEVGGGLLVTGGRRSFGNGGYRKSRLEPLLPVSMEVDQELRKSAIAIALVLDRSGSMSASVSGGLTKMQLANLGCAASIELLSPFDEVAVVAVDSSAHAVVELTPVEDKAGTKSRVMAIEAGGGGIFTYTALVAAADQLAGSSRAVRHIVLFADASDAEEPGDYRKFIPRLLAAGIRISVIALGRETDRDAAFLREVAELGEGAIHFTEEAEALPRLFSMETMAIARSGFVEGATPLRAGPDLPGLGELGDELPEIGGYNFVRPRDRASVAILSDDDAAAPVLAYWQFGTGRVATFAGEADGVFSGGLATWPRYGELFGSVVTWLAAETEAGGAQAFARRDGRDVEVRLELDPDRSETHPLAPPILVAVPDDPGRPVIRRPMQWEGEALLVARYRLEDGDLRHHRIELGDRALRANAVTLPYSPEFERRGDRPGGAALLAEIAERAGGRERLDLSGLFDLETTSVRYRSLTLPLTLLFLLLVVAEIAWRRLGLAFGDSWRFSRSARGDRAPAASTKSVESTTAPDPRRKEGSVDAGEALRAEKRSDALSSLAEAKRRARGE